MNGSIPKSQPQKVKVPKPTQIIQVIDNEDLKERLNPESRLPRQSQHYARIVDHFLVVKQSDQIARSMQAHFERLEKYHVQLLNT